MDNVLNKISESAESKALDRKKEKYPVQRVAVTCQPVVDKDVKDAVKELNPDTGSFGSRG